MKSNVLRSPWQRTLRLATASLVSLSLSLLACDGSDGAGGSEDGGTAATGGTSGAQAGSAQGGAAGSGATSGSGATGGAPAAGGSNGGTPSGGSSGAPNGGSGAVSGASGEGGTGAMGGAATGGTGAMSGAGAMGGAGATGGTGGSGAGQGGSGGAMPPGPSGLPVPPGGGGAPRPAGSAGNLRVIDWAGFEAAVSYTFDDSNSSQVQNYAALNALDVPFTFYLQTGKSESSNAVWMQALSDGHELGNHTRNHSMSDDGTDTDAATAFIESRYSITVYTMAAPYGASVYTNIARTRFLINRGVSNSVIAPNGNADPFTLPCYVPPEGASAGTMNAQVDSARSAGGWRVFLVHGFTGGTDGAFQPVALSEFEATVEHAKSFGDVWIGTVLEVGAYWRAQTMMSAVTPTASGSDSVYSWTLPEHFPPGRYLRVTVDGGTLRQGGAELPWDDHGYYEIALDAGSVTLSP